MESHAGSREWRIGQLAFFGALSLWPVLWGWGVLHALAAAAFVLLFVWLPGRALVAWTLRTDDALERAFLSWLAGSAVLGLCFVGLCVLDLRSMCWILPPASALALFLAGRARPQVALHLPAARELWLLALVLALALARTRPDVPHEWFLGYASDDYFHATNAAELRWRWPLGDPRLAGEPLCYHFLSYSCAAAMSTLLDLPVRECLLGLTQHHMPFAFAFGMFVLARALGAGSWIAAGTALALVLHTDLAFPLRLLTGANWGLVTPFSVGMYNSITNSAGLCLLLGLLLVLHCLLARGAAWRGAPLLAFVLALATAATKASVLPPLVAGMAAALVWKLVRGGGFDRRLAGSTAVVALGAAPMTWWLMGGSGSYAQAMFHWMPAFASRSSGLEARLREIFGVADAAGAPLFSAAILPVWLAFFFGLATLGLVFWVLARERRRDPVEVLLAFTLLAGLVPACLLAAPGSSQLFFGYVSIVVAALLGAFGARRLLSPPGRKARLLASMACLGLCVYAVSAFAGPWGGGTIPIVGEVDEYRAALEWSRMHLPRDAVLLVDEGRLCASAWIERRTFFEVDQFSPRVQAQWDPSRAKGEPSPPSPFRESSEIQQRFLRAPTLEDLARIHAIAGAGAPLYVLQSHVRIERRPRGAVFEILACEGPPSFGAGIGAELAHATTAVRLWRLP